MDLLQILALVQYQVILQPKNPITSVLILFAMAMKLSSEQDQT